MFILTTNTVFTRIRVCSFVMVIAMGFANWSQTSVGAKGFLCLVLMFFYGTGVSKCDLGYTKNSNKTDKRHGLGFLSLGRRNFITDKAEKYRNNLVLTRIRNAQKLNATCIGEYLFFFVLLTLCKTNWHQSPVGSYFFLTLLSVLRGFICNLQ